MNLMPGLASPCTKEAPSNTVLPPILIWQHGVSISIHYSLSLSPKEQSYIHTSVWRHFTSLKEVTYTLYEAHYEAALKEVWLGTATCASEEGDDTLTQAGSNQSPDTRCCLYRMSRMVYWNVWANKSDQIIHFPLSDMFNPVIVAKMSTIMIMNIASAHP